MIASGAPPARRMKSKRTHKLKRPGHLAGAHGSAITAIRSAVLNIGTAMSDCESARDSWIEGNWNDATMWISNAIAQLESAKAKIYAHQEAEQEAESQND